LYSLALSRSLARSLSLSDAGPFEATAFSTFMTRLNTYLGLVGWR
jgi:hypothetical protein